MTGGRIPCARVLAIVWAGSADAHGLAPTGGFPDVPRAAWLADPLATLLVGLAGLAYASGLVRLWSRAGLGRGIGRGEAAAFWAGWSVLALALLSPLASWADRLFVAHMAEHELLMAVAAPLLVLGKPVQGLLWSLPARSRRVAGRVAATRPATFAWKVLTMAPVATLLHGAALWAWHAPPLFDWALASPVWHAAQHLSFFVTAVLFWRGIAIDWQSASRHPERAGAGIAWLFVTCLHMSFLAILLTLAPRPWYAMLGHADLAGGLTPLEDQQLAGLLMGVPAGLVYVGAALALAARWITGSGLRCREMDDAAAQA